MERFEIDNTGNLDTFKTFVGKAKSTFKDFYLTIKDSIKKYENNIEKTEKEISDTETAREKCEQEISRLEKNIDTIKENIESVEATYRKILDAYSTTSKNEIKTIYSDVIEGARSNCEKDVEKNRTEIARLNSSIEGIKNNITEFNSTIDSLKRDLTNYKAELNKFNESLNFIEDVESSLDTNLDNIMMGTFVEKKKPVDVVSNVIEEVKVEPKVEIKETVSEEPAVTNNITDDSVDDSLQRIYDLTGYKPQEHTEKAENHRVEAEEAKPVYNENLENLFKNNEDVSRNNSPVFDDALSEWEKILNEGSGLVNSEPSSPVLRQDDYSTVDQLLQPYGTTFNRLAELVAPSIKYRNGSVKYVELTIEDVVKAINEVDGTDLKDMKTYGPEITLLRKVKKMKEGSR